jgi:hypothetical protein
MGERLPKLVDQVAFGEDLAVQINKGFPDKYSVSKYRILQVIEEVIELPVVSI